MKHYLEYWVLHKDEIEEPESRHYELLLLMNDIALREAFPTTFSESKTPTPPPLAQFVHILEASPPHCVLNDGKSSLHLVTKEEQLPSISQPPPSESTTTLGQERALKRKRGRSPNPKCKRRKLGASSASGRVNLEIDGDSRFLPRDSKPKQPVEVGRILIDLLSLHPHVPTALVGGHTIQFYHANHSVVLVSSVVDLSLQDCKDSIDKFVAILIAFRRLYPLNDKTFHRDQKATMLRLQGNTTAKGPVEIELERWIHMTHSLVKRVTGVVRGASSTWPGSPLVVTISWVKASRTPETDFMDKATEEAGKPGHEWALNHLPRFFYVENADDPSYRSVDELFKNAHFKNGEYTYVRHKMRVMIQEPLQPLGALTNAKDVGQVLLGVACIRRWLYDHPGIFHGELSLSNIMCRTIGGHVYGVLTDYDLLSWKAPPTAEDVNSSQEVTGTIPFMAHDLLDPHKTVTHLVHLYRHDVESFFYVMLILTTHYEIREPGEGEDGGRRGNCNSKTGLNSRITGRSERPNGVGSGERVGNPISSHPRRRKR